MTPEEKKQLEDAKREWETRTLRPALDKSTDRPGLFAGSDGAPLERVYTPEHVADEDYLSDVGFPGEFPYTRGVQPTMYRGRLWTMRQYAGFGSAAETNRRYRYLLEQGQTGLSVAFDLPTQMGYDADHAMAKKQGVAADRLAGTVQNDILKEYIARGTYIYPPAPSMRLITDMFAFCKGRVPRWNTISISGYHIREAGCTA